MRYYSIIITDPDTGNVIKPKWAAKLGLEESYTSYVNGKSLPGALDVEIQVSTVPFAVPRQGSFIRVYGVSREELGRSADLEGKNIVVKAGMQKGLPLANPKQNGVIVQGKIYQCIGNWQMTDFTLDITIIQASITPKNYAFEWKRNTKLADAVKTTLSAAEPNKKLTIAISDRLVAPVDIKASYANVTDFAVAIKKYTSQLPLFKGIQTKSGTKYEGVDIFPREESITVYDGTEDYGQNTFDNPKVIQFIDIIGQPTWVGPSVVNLKTVMRADIWVGDYVKLPEKLASPYVITSPGAGIPGNPSRNKLIFQGTFRVISVYHWGRFRQTSANDWVTTYDVIPVQKEGS